MSGITPYRTLHDIARAAPGLTRRADIEAALDELEYLFEVIPPEMQEYAEPVIASLRDKRRRRAEHASTGLDGAEGTAW